jgi:hypothetical protein
MIWKRGACGVVLLAAGVLLGGCGGGDGQGGRPARKVVESVPPTPLTPDAPKRLSAPVLPRCGTEGFKRRGAGLVKGSSGALWQVNYAVPSDFKHPPKPGRTTVVLIAETAPRGKAAVFKGAPTVNVAGRRVRIARVPRSTQWAASWRTGRASYTMIADGSGTATLERFIACLP